MTTTTLEIIPEEKRGFIEAEGVNLTKDISELVIRKREDYERGLTLGIANVNILRRLEDLRKSLVTPIEMQIKNINEKFKKISSVFEANDDHIRKSLLGYQKNREVENIKTIHTDLGSATIQERKDFDILDEKAVPREYLKLDETKIRRAVTAGILEDNGWIKIKKNLVTAFKVNGGSE